MDRPGSDVHPKRWKIWVSNNISRAAKIYNRARYGSLAKHRVKIYQEKTLLELPTPKFTIKDGWAIDTSHSLPHLDELLVEN